MTHVANMAATYAVTALPHQCFGLDKTCIKRSVVTMKYGEE